MNLDSCIRYFTNGKEPSLSREINKYQFSYTKHYYWKDPKEGINHVDFFVDNYRTSEDSQFKEDSWMVHVRMNQWGIRLIFNKDKSLRACEIGQKTVVSFSVGILRLSNGFVWHPGRGNNYDDKSRPNSSKIQK